MLKIKIDGAKREMIIILLIGLFDMRTSEYVGLGHPDKVADYISEYILDRYVEKDKTTRFALEVQIKDNFVTLGGEVTSSCHFSEKELTAFVKQAVDAIGYTKEYQDFWGAENTICGYVLDVVCHISHQSPQISQGVNRDGWGDQGIFWGYAENNPAHNFMPQDHAMARELSKEIYDARISGLDIKTQITLNNKDELMNVIVAAPIKNKEQKASVAELVATWVEKYRKTSDCEIIVNGTGEYISHSSISDCGTTGRKLVVDFYGGNSKIGGGCPWTKDGTKADLTLNLMARLIAKANLVHNQDKVKKVKASIACCIGRSEVLINIKMEGKDGSVKVYELATELYPSKIMREFGLDMPIFADTHKDGMFYNPQRNWEKVETLDKEFIKNF